MTVTPESKDVGAEIHVRFGAGSDEAVSSGTPSTPVHLSRGRGQNFYVTVAARHKASVAPLARVYKLTVYRASLLREILRWFGFYS